MQLVTFASALLLAAQPAQPAYMFEVRPTKKIEVVMALEITTPSLKVAEWVLIAPRLPEVPGQSQVKSKCSLPWEDVEDLSPLKRPLMRARVKVKDKETESKVAMVVTYELELSSRRLVPVPSGMKAPKVAPLPEAERTLFLQPTSMIDFDTVSFKAWLTDTGLTKKKDESDLEYGKRLYLFVVRRFGYDYAAKMERAGMAVCRIGRSDCGGLSILLVTALRSQGIPARLRVGRWATSAKEGDKLGDVRWSQQHSWAEFFCAGIGWVPADPSGGILVDRSPEKLDYFGYDRGNFVTLHLDHDLVLDTIHGNKHTEAFLQTGAYWVSGTGSLEGARYNDSWVVREVK